MTPIKEKIEVMKAYANGSPIQYRPSDLPDSEWRSIAEPNWNWLEYDYRAEPIKKYRPYRDTDEFLKHFETITTPGDNWKPVKSLLSGVWLRNKSTLNEYLIYGIKSSENKLFIGGFTLSLQNIFEEYTYLDGSTFGIEIDER